MAKNLDEWTGNQVPSTKCRRCKLTVSNDFIGSDQLCKACENLNIIYLVGGFFSRLFPLGILLSGMIWFFAPNLRFLLIPILVIIILPAFLTGILQLRIHMMGIPKDRRVIPILRAYEFIQSFDYYDGALKNWRDVQNKTPEQTRQVFEKLLRYIIMTDKPTPHGWVAEWAEASGMTKSEFVEFLATELPDMYFDSLKPKVGYGVLPDLWEGLKEASKEVKMKTFDSLVEYAKKLDDFTPFERKVFQEELYVISDELIPELKEFDETRYEPLIKLIEEFEPDEVPKNRLDAMVKASELQAQIGKIAKQRAAAKLQGQD